MSTSNKLTPEQRLEIIERVKHGETRVSLATEFGVHERTIRRIIRVDGEEQVDSVTTLRGALASTVDTKVLQTAQTPERGYQSPNVRHGHLVVTREGSYMQLDYDGKMVKVLSCPVYNARYMCVGRYDVEIISMHGKKNGTGRFKRQSGETVMGRLSFSFEDTMATRIEFHEQAD